MFGFSSGVEERFEESLNGPHSGPYDPTGGNPTPLIRPGPQPRVRFLRLRAENLGLPPEAIAKRERAVRSGDCSG